ncbi:MAG: UvrD-helicase domain-containing protein [Chloroflexota bacterium]
MVYPSDLSEQSDQGGLNLTPDQRKAIFTHDRNLIVTAGAGSGKTRVLVQRFIEMLDHYRDWSLPSLVAITFTEKAAREMRDRVRKQIEIRIQELTRDHDPEAVTRWRTHEAALDSARIGTIHGLCATILRANAAEARIDPGFAVLDEVTAAVLREDAIEQALATLGETHLEAVRLLEVYEVPAVSEALRRGIAWSGDWLQQQIDPDDYINQWHDWYAEFAVGAVERLRGDSEFSTALNWEPPNGWPAPTDKLMQNWIRILDHRDTWFSPATPLQTLLDILAFWRDEIDLKGGSAKLWGSADLFETAKAYVKWIRSTATSLLEEIGEFGDPDSLSAELLPLWGQALSAAQAIYKSLKGQDKLDFDDLETLTQRLLKTHPQVAERYRGTEFHHILVDEFQDTNEAQRDIIWALVDLNRPNSLFIVGDPRQSIYAFRGANVSVFNTVTDQITTPDAPAISLSASFRSHERLVSVFNTVFPQLMVKLDGPNRDYGVDYGNLMEAVRESPDRPCLELIVIDKENAAETSRSADDLRRWEARTLAQRLLAIVEAGWLITDELENVQRPIGYGDMAVLFQSRSSMPLVEEAFKAAGIDYVTIAGQGYYDRPEVWDLLNLLKALYNTADDLSLASALRSPLYNLSDDDLFALRLQTPSGTLWDTLIDSQRTYQPTPPNLDQVYFARESLLRLHASAGRITIAELLVRTLEETAYLATLSGLSDGTQRCANVEKLIELARHSEFVALGSFIASLETLNTRTESREGEAPVATEGAVQLMTIHASKGLEFQVVALFDASWHRNAQRPLLVNDPMVGPVCMVRDENNEPLEPFAYRLAQRYQAEREQAERTRLLYVAMTRAQEYLIVSGRLTKDATWLNQLIDTLGMREIVSNGIAPDEELLLSENCLLRMPTMPPSVADTDIEQDRREPTTPRNVTPRGWDALTMQQIEGIDPQEPWLLVQPPVDRQAPAQTLSATEIAVLGESKALGELANFRSHVLRDAPIAVRDVTSHEPGPDVSRRVIGEIVHQALRWWHLPSETPNLHEILNSYAWEQGVTDVQALKIAIEEATRLLQLTEKSNIIVEMQQAEQSRQIYRELPFAFKFGERTINGVIDVLFFSKYGKWHVVDYKTSDVPPVEGLARSESIRQHAERYHAQVGIYAAAIQIMTGQAPEVHLHYIRHVYTVHVPMETWQAVLATLDNDITEALGEH